MATRIGNRITVPAGNILALAPRGTVLFYENFESPVGVPYYDEGIGPDSTKWVRATNGFGSSRHGVDNKGDGLGNWTTSDPANDQTYNFRYTNSGIGTKQGVIGTLDPNNVTYTVYFDYIYDKGVDGTGGGGYWIGLHGINPIDEGGDRARFNSTFLGVFPNSDGGAGAGTPDNSLVYKSSTIDGDIPNDGAFHRFSISYTTDPVTDAGRSGWDLCLRVEGSTISANIDNIKIVRS